MADKVKLLDFIARHVNVPGSISQIFITSQVASGGGVCIITSTSSETSKNSPYLSTVCMITRRARDSLETTYRRERGIGI